ncbi:uncharacterized protein L201_002954 [Kwoniella dendrophila CBS 6074]|uniref:Small nuclear ribonucleoprotein Prp3 C-terminal domain-containing protein n=1 Tax=Kwoniella dendrophila CBS 6074 TaxID=1295534 RepID=A0AAX4JRH7_9TREE
MSNSPEYEAQLDLLQLLTSMYTSEELSLPESTQSILHQYTEDPSFTVPVLDELEAELDLPIDEFDSESTERVIFQIILSLKNNNYTSKVKIRPKQPLFLSRNQYEKMLRDIPIYNDDDNEESSEYLLNTIELIKSKLQSLLSEIALQGNDNDQVEEIDEKDLQIDRIWFWLPTLSTREKRDDMVNFAKDVKLTGFVLAGKPALLCVEGNSQVIEKYMSRIKSESWSDIPKHHKKISERLRRPIENRAFSDMKEITNDISHYGQYNHRGDMSEVKKLMEKWGVGDDFGAVVMNSGY